MARDGLTTSLTCRRIEVGRGGLDAALPWVRFDVARARNDGGGNPNIFGQILLVGCKGVLETTNITRSN